MTMWIVVVAAGLATFGIRLSFVALFGRFSVPARVEQALRYVAPAVLAALAVPGFVAPNGSIEPFNLFVPAAVLGGLAAWKTRSVAAAIAVGLPALWLFQWLA